MRKANFFMVGGPKTATTALSQYLRTHSNVFVCDPKEPYYFSSDVGPSPYARTAKQYMELFSGALPSQTTIVEASVSYLMSAEAYKLIYEFNPQAKILVTLRNPVDLVHAWHSEMLYAGEEGEKDFERAWGLQEERAQGRSLPTLCTRPLLLQYKKVGLLGEGLEKYIRRFGKSQVACMVFDDFKADPRAEYQKLLKFLNLPMEIPEHFAKINGNKLHRVPVLGRSVRYLRQRLAVPIGMAYGALGVHGSGFMVTLDKLNTKMVERAPGRTAFRNHLKAVFRPDVERLESLIDRDLSHWYA
jgi:Sulfotransferase domain